jgi:dTDP-4-amino-4,6-dideoxygalactose transaminase
MRISFSKPSFTFRERGYVVEALASARLAGDGLFSRRCEEHLRTSLGSPAVLLTPSGTHALEMASLLVGLEPGDEVIMPSFTFSSTANAVRLVGATPVFVDIRPDTLNLDERLVESVIGPRTRAITVMHYGGVGCEMDPILEVARRHGLRIIEDAAHGIQARYRGRWLGTIGDLGCFSFHETKNLSCGEGGALVVNDPDLVTRAEVIREKGTNRKAFFRGEIDRYTWTDIGSSYLLGDLSAALLLAQLERADEITRRRVHIWNAYHRHLEGLATSQHIVRPHVPAGCDHNAHIYWIAVRDRATRDALLDHLHELGIHATFHYIPLHSSPAGLRLGELRTRDVHTTSMSERLVRLPLYFDMTDHDVSDVIEGVLGFFETRRDVVGEA